MISLRENKIDDLESYFRSGDETQLNGSDDEAGYALSVETEEYINSQLLQKSIMRQISSTFTISGGSIETGSSSGGWGDIVNDKVIDKGIHIALHELYSQPKILMKMLDDYEFRLLDWLLDQLIYIFSGKENIAFLYGDGIDKPKGIFNCKEVYRITGHDYPTPDAVIDTHSYLGEEYDNGASWLASPSAIDICRRLQSYEGKYFYTPSITSGEPDTFRDKPIRICPEMKGIQLIYGNFKKAYGIADKAKIHILRDPFTDKPFVKFYSTKKVGGEIIDPNAIKILEIK